MSKGINHNIPTTWRWARGDVFHNLSGSFSNDKLWLLSLKNTTSGDTCFFAMRSCLFWVITNRSPLVSSSHFSPLTDWVIWGGMRDDSAEILFQSFLLEVIVSSSGMGRDIHSLMLSIHHFLYWPWHCQLSKMPWRMVLETLLWCMTCPNHVSFHLLMVAWRGSCGPTSPYITIFEAGSWGILCMSRVHTTSPADEQNKQTNKIKHTDRTTLQTSSRWWTKQTNK